MKKRILRISYLCVLSALFVSRSFGQAMPADSIALDNELAIAASHFYRSIGEESRLYNGHEVLPYDTHILNNALYPYDAKTWAPGEVTYDDLVYKNVPMMYDVYKDILIVLLYNKFSVYSLLSSRVHDFSFSGRHFIRIDASQIVDNKTGITTGFYEQLYTGKIEILAKRKKSLQHSSNTATASETSFYSTNDYYLRKGISYYKIGSKSSILKLLKDKKGELQQYLRQNNISYRDDPEGAMAKMGAYYDHLTN